MSDEQETLRRLYAASDDGGALSGDEDIETLRRLYPELIFEGDSDLDLLGRMAGAHPRDIADNNFLIKQMRALDQSAQRDIKIVEDTHRRGILTLLRTRTPGPRTLAMVANELESLWWPKEYEKQHGKSNERARLAYADDLIRHLTADYRKAGIANPTTQAEQAAAEVVGLSVDGLRKARYRFRRARERGRRARKT
jgi:hypothetical protein